MLLTNEELQRLWERYLGKSATPGEVEALFDHIGEQPDDASILDAFDLAVKQSRQDATATDDQVAAEVWEKIRLQRSRLQQIPAPVQHIPKRSVTYQRVAAAAILLIGVAVAFYFIQKISTRSFTPGKTMVNVSVMPAGTAMLTLADGSTIALEGNASKTLAQQGSIQVLQLNSGLLAYRKIGKQLDNTKEDEGYNTIRTPRGGQYQVMLPDGSAVWLNAASSISFPVNIDKGQRDLIVTGEVYIEVKQAAQRPFHIKAGELDIDVLGTSFNLNAYQEEGAVRTTLIDGSIRLHSGAQGGTLLHPGQQGVLVSGDPQITIQAPDLEEVLAWKNGLFKFNKTNIDVVLRQVARWYDLDIVYEGAHPADKFGGEIPRKVSAETILEMIKASGVKLRREGRKVIVL